MSSNIPEPIFETSGDEDLQNIENDINTLATQFISPIENLRSISKPPLSENVSKDQSGASFINDFQNLQIDNNKALESRAHSFYRMLGFPVVAPDGSFYNSGFNPNGSKKLNKSQNINAKINNSSLQNIINLRELLPLSLKKIFAKQDLAASLYTLLLRYTGPFNILDNSKKPLDIDNQTFIIDARNTEIFLFASYNNQLSDKILGTSSTFSNTPVGQNFSGGQHILRPFIVDPRIENTVMPDKNKICCLRMDKYLHALRSIFKR